MGLANSHDLAVASARAGFGVAADTDATIPAEELPSAQWAAASPHRQAARAAAIECFRYRIDDPP
ncbi:hypothetical protein [Luteimonas aquatica]|uniref:hypothetical protein n=1 Tax=Luteimonas aquatica TaxID=450364 RepID=UPI001F5AD5D3|nr:hypothetical protein [Luteimonas aquatica]